MARYASIGHRFWVMFSLWVAAISVVTALGVYAAANSGRQAIARQELEREAQYYGRQLARDPDAPLPDTWLIRGYRQAPGQPDAVPLELRGLAPGYHQVRLSDGMLGTVLVSDGPHGRLYLLFNNDRPNTVVMLFGLVPVVLVVLIIYLATWLTYRASRKALSPVIALAKVIRRWNPDHPEPESLAPGNLPAATDSDIEVLVTALYNFANRLEAFVERERNFTRDASHELRTPLTVMKIAVDVLADEDMSPFAQRSLARIRRSVREMEALIETFLVLARESDTGLRDEDFLANDVVAAEVARYRELMGGKPVELNLVVRGDGRQPDPQRLPLHRAGQRHRRGGGGQGAGDRYRLRHERGRSRARLPGVLSRQPHRRPGPRHRPRDRAPHRRSLRLAGHAGKQARRRHHRDRVLSRRAAPRRRVAGAAGAGASRGCRNRRVSGGCPRANLHRNGFAGHHHVSASR